jgi:predicted exporter
MTKIATLVVLALTAIGFALAAPHFKFSTKITEFLPDDSANRSAQIAAMLSDSELARVMVIDLSGAPDLPALAHELVAFLRTQPDVATARSGFSEADVTAVMAFLARWPATTFLPRTAYGDGELHARLAALRDQLGSPAGVMFRDTAPRDPLGGMWVPLEALKQSRGTALVDEDGVVLTADHQHALVFVETRSSPFESVAQIAFRALLQDWTSKHAPARMQTSGTAQFAIASEAQIKRDVNRIGIISTIGMLAIFLVLFGSIRMILLGFVPMLFGSAIAVLACEALFGEIHGITIAFGTSLLGVGLDYVEHYYAHFVLTPEVPARTTMKSVGPSLVLGAVTTIIGFVGIAASGLGGLRQMAVFSMIAIVASMAATYWMVPQWMPTTYRAPRTLGAVNRAVLALLVRVTSIHWSRRARLAGVLLAIAGAAVALRAAAFSDNVNMLVDDHGPHVAENTAVRARLGPETTTYAVVTAATDEDLLATIAKTATELDQARATGILVSYTPLDRLVPSLAEQGARFAAGKAAAPRIRAAMIAEDFVPDQFQPFWDALEAPPTLMRLDDVRRSPLAPLLTAWIPAHATPIALIPLVGVMDVARLRTMVPSASIVVPTETIVELFRDVRIHTVIASVLGLVAIFVLLLVRYRSAHKVVIALLPAVLACAATVGTLVVLATPLTILHVMSLLLVVSLGVDFGIFFVDTTSSLEENARTLVSILTASATTILSFGLLGLSASPGLAAIGITVTLGVTYSLVFCFVMASLAGPRLGVPS